MDRKAAKEVLHIEGWLDRAGGVVARGKHAYLADDLLQKSLTPLVDEARAALDADTG